jgi:hypothetical protein
MVKERLKFSLDILNKESILLLRQESNLLRYSCYCGTVLDENISYPDTTEQKQMTYNCRSFAFVIFDVLQAPCFLLLVACKVRGFIC